MIEDLIIPEIFCPFPSLISPYADSVNQQTLDWVRRFGLVADMEAMSRLEKSKFGLLAARAYPQAEPDSLEIVSNWNTWLFILDDQCDELGIGKNPEDLMILHKRCLDVLAGNQLNSDDPALVVAIEDLRMRLLARMSSSWMLRFTHSVSEYFESTEWEAKNRRQQLWPGIEAYIRLRPYTGGLLTDIDLIDLTESISLPIEVRRHPTIDALIAITNNVVCWSNDIISLQKERSYQDMHNLALIIYHRESIGLQAAIDKVNDMIGAEVRRFQTLKATLPRFGDQIDQDVSKLIAVLQAWMRGNLDWSFESGRYFPNDGNEKQSNKPGQRAEKFEVIM